ncbi:MULTISPECIES: glycosyltransferase [unclassified Bifidobacterium]|uniref:glycosyltransferase n=1 Tax=unclassified Bifidobacterium TaxID=2608897 RepID=UPI00112AD862|nr:MULTISPECIES: glycosyltransferase [unclassified Bifidobacterium]TPF78517.1 glycosyl transferase family 1 [Bifidobacterium sp. UTCIF-1]TPF80797.1 glycosyl transferase family 1 [Bifidobacterium sp. UTCIF-24]TPF82763.1 glycosyl transferase family 1 [Bifidobacterium sp. UTCIF-3]TPF84464.1 glycosyl transferase family 1 [Bifidobacterium sp. UTCIF-36]TPF90976.1 glycosyl transferase family 1 [Bifidobacterium sp. UTBIF-56]
MKILLINKYFYRKGGAETYFFALAEGLKTLGHEVAFFSMQHPNNEPSYWSKYFVSEKDYVGKISAFQQAKEAATLVYSFESKHKFEALLEEFQPDVIHMNNVHRQLTLSILDAPYLKKHHVPVVYTAHDYILLCPAYTMVDGSGNVCDRCLDRRFFHAVEHTCVKGSKAKSGLAFLEAEFLKYHHSYDKIDRIIAPSEFMKNKLDEGGYAGRTIAMQNFLTESQMAMARKVTNTAKFDTVEPYFLFFGRLSKEKGILTLVRAFLDAAGKSLPQDWKLHIVGDGPERGTIENLIAQAGPEASQRIALLGYKTGEELQREVGNARFSVLCSEWRENMPYSGLESLAAQTPVIGANIGGIPELVVEGKTGFCFNSGDMHSLVGALLHAAALDGSLYLSMQRECGIYVAQRTLQSTYIRALEELYACCLQENGTNT